MKHKHPDDEPFSDDELRHMEAGLALIEAQHHALAEGKEADADGDEKITKQEAHYRPGTAHRFCEACSMFLYPHRDNRNGDGECSLVEGTISPSALCDHYERKKERAAGGAADQDEDDSGKVHYERVAGVAPPGSFRLSHHAVRALGQNDPRTAGRVISSLFGQGVNGDPTVVHPDVVRDLGHGDVKTGHRVLQRFVQRLGRGNGNHARG
jgi:hypothetical protein